MVRAVRVVGLALPGADGARRWAGSAGGLRLQGGGQRPCVGHGIYTGFELGHFPDKVDPFQTCLHIVSTKGMKAPFNTPGSADHARTSYSRVSVPTS